MAPLTVIGTTLGQYRVLDKLGEGGMGEIYLAEDSRLGRRIALKVLRRGRGEDAEHRQRFEREAKAVAALNHPNIVTIHSVEQAGDVTFLTMELVEGKTLSEIVPKGGLPVERLLKLAIPLADAVAAAHERGITHRDLKPANVMVTHEGRVKVLDFGLAKLREATEAEGATMTGLSAQPLTGEGRIVGTVAYMSPEQAEGKALDPRTDIFSLGVVLYEIATGERPFKGDTAVSVISSIMKDTPPSLTDVNQAVPRHLARIVKRALVKDPDHRYQSAKDLRNDLETLKEELDSGVMEAPAATGGRPKAVVQTRLMPIAAAAVLVLLVAGGLWYFLYSGPAPPAERPFERVSFTRMTSTGKVTLAAISSDGRYVVHVVDDAGKQSLWLRQVATTSNVQIVAPEEARYDALTFSPDGNFVYYTVYPRAQNFASVFQVPVLGGTPRQVIDDVDSPLAFSPDGKECAFLRGYQRLGEGVLFIVSPDGTGERRVLTLKYPLSFLLQNVVWSPDGRTLVAATRADVQGGVKLIAVDAKTGGATNVGDKIWAFVESVAWMPDGRGLVAAAQDVTPSASMQIWYVPFPGGEVRRITNDLNNYAQVTLSRDATSLVATQRELRANVWVAPLADPSHATQVTTGSQRIDGFQAGLAWTPDGRIVYTSNVSGNLDLWISDASGTNPRQLTVDPSGDDNPIVTPDGRSIIFIAQRGGGGIWRMDPDGANQRVLVADPVVNAFAVSPDSKWLYYSLATAVPHQVWRLPLGGGAAERLTARWEELGITDPGAFYHPTVTILRVSPDGKELAGFYADPDRRGFRVGIFPIAGGKPRRTDLLVPAVAWMPDGRSLIYGDVAGGLGVLSRLPLSGGSATRVASYPTDSIMGFALSYDGKQLALSRGTTSSDVVLITRDK